MYYVTHTPEFEELFLKTLSSVQQRKVRNLIEKQLLNNPYVGDHLGRPFFREKRVKEKRVYFLIYEKLKSVLLVSISDKKTQQITIDDIQDDLEIYSAFIVERLKQRGTPFYQQTPSNSEQSGQ